MLHILQDHYPETLGRALVTNLPFILNFFYKGISPFLDPVTRDKMRFNPNLLELIDEDQLDSDFGGNYEFEFEPNSYWDQIVEWVFLGRDSPDLPLICRPSFNLDCAALLQMVHT